jgi:site-specific recombinase XerD
VARSWRAAGAEGDTWVVLARDHSVVGPAEEFLEHLRVEGYSPNTVKQYARALALWWSLLEDTGRDWRQVGVQDLAAFTRRVRARGVDPAVVELRPAAPAADSTVGVTVRAVMSFYRFQALAGGVGAVQGFYLRVRGTYEACSPYMPFLAHVGRGGVRSVVGRRRGPVSAPPVLLPQQVKVIKDDAARWDAAGRRWAGDLRYRLFWSLLEETGLRLAEALLLQHRDWHTGTGTTAFIEVVPREDHRRRLRVKGQKYRRLYVGDALDDLYGGYLCDLADAGADFGDGGFVFTNIVRGPLGAPLRPESVYAWVRGFKRRHPLLPQAWTPHWFRHSHATALLLAGVPVHVVQRRLGHADIQTLMRTYAHVTDDAEMRAVADWRSFVDRWGVTVESQ